MLYLRCVTCRTLLANKQIIWESKLDEIDGNNKLSKSEKYMRKRKLLDELELHRPCCRSRIMGYTRLINKIK